MAVELKPLGYDYDALSPVLDANTLSFHHDKHHQTYVNNLNNLIAGTELDNMSLEEIILNIDKAPAEKQTGIKNNVGGVYNHNLYWETMTPGGSNIPFGNLAKAIDEKFGSFDAFKKEFEVKGAGRFGSGWVSLIKTNDGIEIKSYANQDTSVADGHTTIISNDVWEHAYYLGYQNRRAEYLTKWWELVNWDIAEKRFNA